MDRKNEQVELFRAFSIDEVEDRAQNGGPSGLGDYDYYKCSLIGGFKS